LLQRLLHHRAARYFIVGCIAVAVQLSALLVCVEWFHMAKVPASVTAFLIAVSLNYVMQRRFTFVSDVDHMRAAPRFLAVGTVSALVNTALFAYLATLMHYFVAQTITILAVFVLNYQLNRRITFRTG
jgi:putative flippase GtrA